MSTEQVFGDLAAVYQAFRPRYPAASLEWLRGLVGRPATVVDVGSGTGILTRQLAALFPDAHCIGVEPGSGMMEAARESTAPDSAIHYLDAPAEALPLPDRSADMVTVGQALHWFDRPRFFAEAARVLAPGGWLAVLYNDRDTADPLVQAYEALTMVVETDAAIGAQRAGLGLLMNREGAFRAELDAHPDFGPTEQSVVAWPRVMSKDEFLGLCFSTATLRSTIEREGEAKVMAELLAIVEAHANSHGRLTMPYVTTVFAAERR